MFAKFDVKLQNIPNFRYFKETGEAVYNESIKFVKELDDYITPDGFIDAEELKNDWFEDVKADIFLSHSHKDKDLVIALAGWLKHELGLTAFVDSCLWGYANNLITSINQRYNVIGRNVGSTIYTYNGVVYAASNVHMMLATAITKMISQCESLFFINTSNAAIQLTNGDTQTSSPWIYFESVLANEMPPRIPDRYCSMQHSDAMHFMLEQASMPSFAYPLVLKKYIPLSEELLCTWVRCGERGSAALDELYKMTGVQPTQGDNWRN